MRIFKTKWFRRFARKEGISDETLREAVGRAESGLIDGDLGGGLIKQRVARPGKGRSGGFRTLLAYRAGDLAVFLYGFAKSERENIDDSELKVWQELGAGWLRANDTHWNRQVREGLAEEVENDESSDDKA
jgi:hypothetical protein